MIKHKRMVRKTYRFPQELIDQIEAKAIQEDLNVSQLIRKILKNYFK